MTGRGNIIFVDSLHKSFGNVKALDGLTLNISAGIFGLIGPNGAGKTTLLRILLGLAKPDGGHASIFGQSINEDGGIRERIGVLHEHPYYYPSMAAKRYLDLVGSMYPTCKESTEVLSLVNLSDAADRKIGEFSAGMKRRLGIAQAIIGNPELVFLDEPTSNLDVDGRDIVIRLLVDLYEEEGVSFFLSSHILSEVERACHNVAFIQSGKVIDSGLVSELIRKHTENRFKVLTPDAKRLSQALEHEDGVIDVLVTGSSTVIIEVTPNVAEQIESKVERIAKDANTDVFEIEGTGNLEDVYRKVTKSGKA
ncbi:MAG: ABC transporter ATP-binding protein [Candidatus Thorarchaeota archaeon]